MATLRGFDTSYAETFDPSLSGISFIIAKASEGTATDSEWGRHSTQALRAKLPLIAYHFLRSEVPIPAQVTHFLSLSSFASGWAVDFEMSNSRTLPSVAQVREFIAGVQATGRRIGLYQSQDSPGPYPADAFGADWRWVAIWGSRPPSVPWDVWQSAAGHPDPDEFNGDLTRFHAVITAPRGSTPAGPPSPPPIPPPTDTATESPDTVWSPVFVAAVRFANYVGADVPLPPWAAAQHLTVGHFGAPTGHVPAVNYLADFIYRTALTTRNTWRAGNREANVVNPGTVPAGTTDPAALCTPVYLAAVGAARSVSLAVPLPSWAASQGLTVDHLGHPPTIASGADYVLAILDRVLAKIGGTPVPVPPPPPPPTETPPGSGKPPPGPSGTPPPAPGHTGGPPDVTPPPSYAPPPPNVLPPPIVTPIGPPGPGLVGVFAAYDGLRKVTNNDMPTLTGVLANVVRQFASI